MAGILIVAHTPLASALLDFVSHVYGEIPDKIVAIDVPPHEDAKITFQRMADCAMKVADKQGVLIITDILGATPANVASRLANSRLNTFPIKVLTGVNLPMLLRAVSHRHEPLDEMVDKSLQGGQQGVLRIRTQQSITTT